MSETTRLVTAEELEKYPDDDYRYELVEGRVIRMSPVGFEHGKTVAQFMFLLHRHLYQRNLGVVLTEVGFKLASTPDTVRAPDVAFVRQDRMTTGVPKGFWIGPPDLAVEVLSPVDRPSEIQERIEEYLQRGVLLAVVIEPDEKSVELFRPSGPPIRLRSQDDLLDLSDIVPGFCCSLREIFE